METLYNCYTATMQTCPHCNIAILNAPKSPAISPIASLLTTNNPPEPHEAAVARQVIASSKTEIAHLTWIIDQVYDILDDLKSRRGKYKRDVILHQNVIRNIRRIPPNVLLEIFSHTVVEGHSNDIWAVVEVCRRWREVALATPTLWSTFPFQEPFRLSGPFASDILSRLSRSLQLSRSAPFKLSISYEKSNYPVCPFQVLASPHSKRITRLTVRNLPTLESQLMPFWSSPPGLVQWDSLRSLELQGSDAASLESLPITVFQHAPLLQDVNLNFALNRWRILSRISNLFLPWSRLRKFSASNISFECVFTVPQAASILEECCVDVVARPPWSLNNSILTHQSLATLHVFLPDECPAHELLSRLSLPCLRKLSVAAATLDIAIICTLIERSSCGITFLNLPTARSPVPGDLYNALRRLFSLIPDVIDLCLPFSFAFLWQTIAETPDGRSLEPPACILGDIAVPPLETITFTSADMLLIGAIPDWVPENDQVEILRRWNYELGELSRVIKVDAMEDDNAAHHDLDRILSHISAESDTGLSGQYLCHKTGREVVSNLQDLLQQLPDRLCLLRGRISAILDLWSPRIQEYQASSGWMESETAKTVVYARRRGLLYPTIRDRTKNCFASFALQNGYLTL
ncbi:unnamed protein product [Cyclocybe aegerita]|uniref:F-box domain-containing protein n=1 Tax=Cyclocybe aegerita TaxID=1973307 RepID=A0A8S0WZW6_CYCAE|nr:unnamed protein product [Cyclocybe aegerita]